MRRLDLKSLVDEEGYKLVVVVDPSKCKNRLPVSSNYDFRWAVPCTGNMIACVGETMNYAFVVSEAIAQSIHVPDMEARQGDVSRYQANILDRWLQAYVDRNSYNNRVEDMGR